MTIFWELLPGVVWVTMISFILVRWHLRALRRYKMQMDLTKGMEAGMVVIANNQHFRYLIRVIEAITALVIGVAGMVGVFYPVIVRHPLYGIGILLFFYGNQAATGWLSQRDLHVLDLIDEIDRSA